MQNNIVLVRGGGDLASGVALRLHRAGIKTLIIELPQPLAVRRAVSLSSAIYEGHITIEGITGRFAQPDQISVAHIQNEIPIMIDPDASILIDSRFSFCVLVDGRMLKQPPDPLPRPVPLHIGLGPGFHAGENCHAVIETRRGHTLGRVYWNGPPQPDSGQPEGDPRRVLRAPVDGIVVGIKKIGDHCEQGEIVAMISDQFALPAPGLQAQVSKVEGSVISPFSGVLRGLIHDGLSVTRGMKIGDVDPRDDASACFLVSDKALAVGGAVLEAILSKPEIRKQLWE
jgi:xanthine dehydrogenase accessory factor